MATAAFATASEKVKAGFLVCASWGKDGVLYKGFLVGVIRKRTRIAFRSCKYIMVMACLVWRTQLRAISFFYKIMSLAVIIYD